MQAFFINAMIQHPQSIIMAKARKVSKFKTEKKTYKVTVTYIEISEEEQRIKRSILEAILKKAWYNNPHTQATVAR